MEKTRGLSRRFVYITYLSYKNVTLSNNNRKVSFLTNCNRKLWPFEISELRIEKEEGQHTISPLFYWWTGRLKLIVFIVKNYSGLWPYGKNMSSIQESTQKNSCSICHNATIFTTESFPTSQKTPKASLDFSTKYQFSVL